MPEMERPWPSPPDMRVLRSPLGLGPCWVGRIWRHPRAGIFRRKRTDIRVQAMRRSTASPRPDAPAILSGATPDPANSWSIRWPVRARSGTWLGPSVGARFPSISSHDHGMCFGRKHGPGPCRTKPPYSANIAYGRDPRCLGRISCRDPRFYEEMRRVAAEARRVLVPGGTLAWIIADEYRGGVYTPAGFRMLNVLTEAFEPIDTVVLVRHHDRSASPMWEHRARRFNFYLRGFKFLFILRKPVGESGG